MENKKDFSPTVYKFKDSVMEHVENTDIFKSYIKTTEFTQLFQGTLWAEGPCYIPHNDILVWSDNPNNRMMKLVNGKVEASLTLAGSPRLPSALGRSPQIGTRGFQIEIWIVFHRD